MFASTVADRKFLRGAKRRSPGQTPNSGPNAEFRAKRRAKRRTPNNVTDLMVFIRMCEKFHQLLAVVQWLMIGIFTSTVADDWYIYKYSG